MTGMRASLAPSPATTAAPPNAPLVLRGLPIVRVGKGRTMRRLILSASFGLLATLILAVPALAGVTWCRADPIVRLGADEYQIIVSVPDANVGQIDDALYFKFTSPYGTVQETLFLDAGFNGEGE